MDRKIIIAVAPTGGWGRGDNNPITPDAIARDVIACAQAGAAIVHMHARNVQGELTTDLSPFATTVSAIKASCDIILEASTGGLSTLTAAERVLPATVPQAEMGSLNIGSLNFGDAVYQNSLPDVRFWVDEMVRRGIKPSLEIFDTGHLETARHLIQEGHVAPPCNFSFIFNIHWGMPYDPALLAYLKSRLPAGSRWGGLLIHSRGFANHIEAARAGAAVLRTGFEDSFNYNGKTATSNAELVTALRKELEAAGFSIASAPEARAMLLG